MTLPLLSRAPSPPLAGWPARAAPAQAPPARAGRAARGRAAFPCRRRRCSGGGALIESLIQHSFPCASVVFRARVDCVCVARVFSHSEQPFSSGRARAQKMRFRESCPVHRLCLLKAWDFSALSARPPPPQGDGEPRGEAARGAPCREARETAPRDCIKALTHLQRCSLVFSIDCGRVSALLFGDLTPPPNEMRVSIFAGLCA